jgi:WD40 repeat protein
MPWYDALRDDTTVRFFGLGTLSDLSFSPSGERIATAGNLGAVIWDVREARVTRRVLTSADIHALAFSREGTRLALLGSEQEVLLADLDSGALHAIEPSEDHEKVDLGMIDSSPLSFHPGGRWLLCRGKGGASIVDAEGGRSYGIDEELAGELGRPIGWSADGALICVSPGQVAFRPLDERSGLSRENASRVLDLPVKDGLIEVSPDGRLLAAYVGDDHYRIFALEDGTEIASFLQTQVKGIHVARGICLVESFGRSPGNSVRAIAIGGRERTSLEIPKGVERAWSLRVCANGRFVAAIDYALRTIDVYDWERGEEIAKLGGYVESDGNLTGVMVDAEGRRGAMLGFGGEGQDMRAWLRGWDLVRDAPTAPEADDAMVASLSAVFVPATNEVAMPFLGGGVALLAWGAEERRLLDGDDDDGDGDDGDDDDGDDDDGDDDDGDHIVHCVALSPDGTLLAGGGWGSLAIWEVESGRSIARVDSHLGEVHWVAWHPGGDLVATASLDGTVRLWSLAAVRAGQRSPLSTLPVGATLSQVCFSPEGSLVACGSHDGSASVFRVSDGGLVHRLGGHSGEVLALSFHPGGRELITGDRAGRLRVHRLEDGSPVAQRELSVDVPDMDSAAGTGVCSTCFEPDGRALWVAQWSGQIRRFSLD